jgi:diguanylate cyclase (GGDEF)-like protein
MTSSEVESFSFRIITKEGREEWIGHVCQPVYDRDGHWRGRRGSSRIITQYKLAEDTLKKTNEILQALATLDGLTQIANRRRFDEYLAEQWQNSLSGCLPFSLILCDIDYFKLYNDTYGHQAGDDCLRAVAEAITCAIRRTSDLVARYGGEEFAVILPNTRLEGAMTVAESMQSEIESLKIPHEKSGVSEFITLSIGIACVETNSEFPSDSLIALADEAMYEAKEKGRNQIVSRGCFSGKAK